jgi:hypothetical protein
MKVLVIGGNRNAMASFGQRLQAHGAEIGEWREGKAHSFSGGERLPIWCEGVVHLAREHTLLSDKLKTACDRESLAFARVTHQWSHAYQVLVDRHIITPLPSVAAPEVAEAKPATAYWPPAAAPGGKPAGRMSTTDVAAVLGLKRWQVDQLAKEGKLSEAVRWREPGGRGMPACWYLESEVEALLAARTPTAPEPPCSQVAHAPWDEQAARGALQDAVNALVALAVQKANAEVTQARKERDAALTELKALRETLRSLVK